MLLPLVGVSSEAGETFLGLILVLLTVVEVVLEVGDALFGVRHVLLEMTPRFRFLSS